MVLRPPPPPGLLVAEARAPVTQVPVQGFSALPEAGWGQEWGCHGLNSDPPRPPKSTSARNVASHGHVVFAVLR